MRPVVTTVSPVVSRVTRRSGRVAPGFLRSFADAEGGTGVARGSSGTEEDMQERRFGRSLGTNLTVSGMVLCALLTGSNLFGCAAAPDEVSDPPIDDEVASTEEALTACHRFATIYPQTRDADRWIIDRALSWVDARVMYSQSAPFHNGWRRDCSGLVSMAWKLVETKPGLVTWTLSNRSHPIPWHELRPGDAINKPHHHAMLFAGWMNKQHTRACVIEEYSYGHPAEIRVRDRSDMVAIGYQPIRRDN